MADVWREAARLRAARVPFAVATIARAIGSVPAKAGAKMLVTADGRAFGTVGGAGLEERVKAMAADALRARKGDLVRFDLANWRPGGLDSVCGGTVEVALEVVLPVPHLLLAGGGHVAKAVYDAARLLDWQVTVQDDRAEYASRERFPEAEDVVVASPDWYATADLARYSDLFILGYSHALDTEILKHAVARFPGRIGVIGSKAKRASMWERLAKAGVPDDALARVECPIGLAIGAESPAEIAVAVVADVIRKERNA